MNAKQRKKNRTTASELFALNRAERLRKHVCPNCGEPGGHWIAMPMNLEQIMHSKPEQGFWICDKYYDPETGRRKEEEIDPNIANPFNAALGSILGIMLHGRI